MQQRSASNPTLSADRPIRSALMAAIRSKDTRPELVVRRLAHAMGFRYRLHDRRLPGKPDMTFPAKRKIIFVHGCFWHQHGCAASHLPRTNESYWLPKLERNQERDIEHLAALRLAGWKCLVIWECQISSPASLRRRLLRFLS